MDDMPWGWVEYLAAVLATLFILLALVAIVDTAWHIARRKVGG